MTSLLEQMKKKTGRYLPLEQDGVTYNLYDLPDGFVIKGDVNLSNRGLTELPDLSRVTVEGNFLCQYNRLTTLQGAPREVGGNFSCPNNKLTSLQGAPQKVGGDFSCRNNQLTSLQGAPQEVGGYFNCRKNQLTTLHGAPQKVGGDFNCGGNKLTSLEGAPQKVGEHFSCRYNQLTSLAGISQMKEGMLIECDNEVAKKYGLSSDAFGSFGAFGEFHAEELYNSPQYIAEFGNQSRIAMLRQKIADGKDLSRSEEQVLEQAKHRSGYAAFKKRMAKEREE